ncbi:MAG: ECF transporter S component [Lachnospiraceae bacterium]|nr:ECF transporter S component [Lachnospiraceae bacterium]
MKRNRDVSYRRHYQPEVERKKRLVRNLCLLGVIVLLLACLFLFSQLAYMNTHYLLVSVFVLAGGLLPVFVSFEQRRPQAREVVLLAVMTALCVGVNVLCSHTIPLHAGTMLVILTGIALGPEAGFLVGALGRLVCNFFDGQGPWTPWQMLTWGLLGLLAGLVFYRGGSRRKRIDGNGVFGRNPNSDGKEKKSISLRESILCMTVFTFLSVFIIYGGVMNLAAWLMSHAMSPTDTPLTLEELLVIYVTGAPYDILHGAGAAICMFLFGDILLQKIRRVQIKFGIYIG